MNTSAQHERDLRIDVFRGMALVFIFIDHIPDNTWANATLRNFGFADASEVFVLLAGYSAGLAYGIADGRCDFRAALERATRRAGQIYVWHIGILVASAALLFAAAGYFDNPSYVDNIVLRDLATDPARSVVAALALVYQPNQMNILPLYVVLMLWLPFVVLLMRRSPAWTLALSFGIWFIANWIGLNLPANRPGEGWQFNPLAWQLLFTTGAAASVLARQAPRQPHTHVLAAASAYLLFAFVVAAPWVRIAWLPNEPLLPPDLIAMSKKDLSAWRFVHVLALAYLVAALVPASSAWLRRPWAMVLARCGRFSLEIFALGTLLSFFGWIALTEIGTDQMTMFVVNVAGIAILGMTAWQMSRRKLHRTRRLAPPPAHAVAS